MAATGTKASTIVNILNEGTIDLQGKKVQVCMLINSLRVRVQVLLNYLTLGDLGKDGKPGDAENVGISNKGKFTFQGNLEVNGKKIFWNI